MKATICLAVVFAALGISGDTGAQGLSQSPVIQIQRGTVIAFFTPALKSTNEGADLNEGLGDFQFYAERTKEPLNELNIDFKEQYARSFRIHISGTDVVFRPKSDAVGYYLIAPGKKPRIEYGVMTDSDLLAVAKRYFGLSVKHE